MAQVRHTWSDGQVRDPRYAARLSPRGLSFRPLRPGEAAARRPLEVETASLRVGRTMLLEPSSQRPPFAEQGRVARRTLAPGLVEEVAAGDGALEQSWRLDRLPERGELVIEVAVRGMTHAGSGPGGLRFVDHASGLAATYGPALARDARGLELQVQPVPRRGGLTIRIPATYVEQVALPLLIDPTISAEIGMDTAIAGNPAEVQNGPRSATSGSGYLVVWQDYRTLDGRYHIYGARLGATGALLDPTGIEISTTTNDQRDPDVAWGGGTYLVVWRESGQAPATSSYDIYGSRVSSTGAVQDAGGVAIGSTTAAEYAPRVAYGGNQFLVAWYRSGGGSNGYDVGAARVTPAGAVLDGSGIAVSTSSGNQTYPHLSASGSTFLVAWTDTRNAATTEDLYAARVDASGTVLDAAGVAVSTAAGNQRYPCVAGSASGWLVAWEDARDYNLTYYDLYAARVSSAGVVLESSGIKVSGWNGNETAARAASDGTDYLVIWNDGTTVVPGSVGGARIQGDGTLLDSPGFQVNVSGQSDLDYNATAQHYFVPRAAGGLSTDVFARRVAGNGAAIDTSDIVVTQAHNAQYYPAVAFDGTNYLVVWTDSRNWSTSGWDLYAVRVSATGTVLDPAGLVICNANGTQAYPDVAFDGTNYFVVWEDSRPGTNYRDIYGGRVTQSGTLLDSQGFQLSGQLYDQRYPRVAFDQSGNYLVVWQDYRNQSLTPARGWDIYGTRVRASDAFVFEQLSGIQISSQTTHELNPALAFDGTNFLVVWSDARNTTSGYDIYGARVDLGGQVLDAAGVAISTMPGNQTVPDIMFHGTSYLAVWQDARFSSPYTNDIYGVSVSTAPAPSTATGFPVAYAVGEQTLPRLALVGKAPLVVWEDRPDLTHTKRDIRGARVGGSTVLESFVVSNDARNELWPVVGQGSGSGGLVAYMNYDVSLKIVRVVARTVDETCSTGSQCPPGTFCSGGKCVPCNTSAACGPSCVPCAPGTYCTGTTCAPCNTAAHCGPSCVACSGATPYCNVNLCVECLMNAHCTSPATCVGFVCVLPPDQGVPDLALPDLALPDTAAPDSPGPDLALPDAGQPNEMGGTDLQIPEAGVDAGGDGPVVDSGAQDSAPHDQSTGEGYLHEGGPDKGQPPGSSDGCNCSVGAQVPPAPLWLLLGLVAWLGLRRRW